MAAIAMSALGTKRTCTSAPHMSAIGGSGHCADRALDAMPFQMVDSASSSAVGARYPRCKVIVAPCTSAFASCDLIVTDCLSPRVTKFKLAVNVGPFATT